MKTRRPQWGPSPHIKLEPSLTPKMGETRGERYVRLLRTPMCLLAYVTKE